MKQFENRLKELLSDQELFLFMQSLDNEFKKSIRINPLRTPIEINLGEKLSWCDRGYFFNIQTLGVKPNLHPALLSGRAFIQEAGAMEVVEYLDVQPGMYVLDLCAAPGAKSTQIGEKLKDTGWLVSNEVVRDRARVLDALLMRHGISRSTVYNLKPHELSLRFQNKFDRILVDAPCSGESLFAKRNEKRKDVSNKEVKQCQKRQLSILDSAVQMLKAGGKLIYSTCTYSKDENENVIDSFLKNHIEFELQSQHRRWPHKDKVPGGYFAVIVKKGHWVKDVIDLSSFFDNTHGLLRAGLKRWNGELDLYAHAMDLFYADKGAFSGDYKIKRDEISKFLMSSTVDITDGVYRLLDSDSAVVMGCFRVVNKKLTLLIPKAVL